MSGILIALAIQLDPYGDDPVVWSGKEPILWFIIGALVVFSIMTSKQRQREAEEENRQRLDRLNREGREIYLRANPEAGAEQPSTQAEGVDPVDDDARGSHDRA
jgi:hypothetical protein